MPVIGSYTEPPQGCILIFFYTFTLSITYRKRIFCIDSLLFVNFAVPFYSFSVITASGKHVLCFCQLMSSRFMISLCDFSFVFFNSIF